MGRKGHKAGERLGVPCPGSVGWPHGDCLQVLPGTRPQCLRALGLNGTAGTPRTLPADAEGGLHGGRGAGGCEGQRPSSVRHTWRRRPEDGHSQLSTVTRTPTATLANVHGPQPRAGTAPAASEEQGPRPHAVSRGDSAHKEAGTRSSAASARSQPRRSGLSSRALHPGLGLARDLTPNRPRLSQGRAWIPEPGPGRRREALCVPRLSRGRCAVRATIHRRKLRPGAVKDSPKVTRLAAEK